MINQEQLEADLQAAVDQLRRKWSACFIVVCAHGDKIQFVSNADPKDAPLILQAAHRISLTTTPQEDP